MFLNESDKCFNYFLFKKNIEIKIISLFHHYISFINTNLCE